jgi:membrane protein DedA with SNARE-associated domain
MIMIQQIEQFLLELAEKIPLEIFTFIGAFAEEVISPIPSAVVLITAGGILNTQSGLIYTIGLLALIAAVAKLLGSLLLYFLADKFEDVAIVKFGKFFGVSHDDIESFGARFKKKNVGVLLLAFLYFLPIIPSGPVSVMSGFFKVHLPTFIAGNFVGTFIKSCLYLYIGFTGADFYEKWSGGLATAESYVQFGLVALIVGGIIWYKFFKKKNN